MKLLVTAGAAGEDLLHILGAEPLTRYEMAVGDGSYNVGSDAAGVIVLAVPAPAGKVRIAEVWPGMAGEPGAEAERRGPATDLKPAKG